VEEEGWGARKGWSREKMEERKGVEGKGGEGAYLQTLTDASQ